MTWNEETVKKFGQKIQRLIKKENMSREEMTGCFGQILENQQPELQ